jgi:hypothetical protein
MKCRICGGNAYREQPLISSDDVLLLCVAHHEAYRIAMLSAPKLPCNCHKIKAEVEFLLQHLKAPRVETRDPGPREKL